MYVITILLVGLAVGALAKFFIPGPSSPSMASALLGVAGALVAGMIARSFGWYHTTYHVPGITASIFGAMVVLFVHRLLMRPRSGG